MAGELTILGPGRGSRVAGETICLWAPRAGDEAATLAGVAEAAFGRDGVAAPCSTRATGTVLLVAIVALRFASISFEPWGMDSTTASRTLDPPWICRSLLISWRRLKMTAALTP
jgi:hypothetical protein